MTAHVGPNLVSRPNRPGFELLHGMIGVVQSVSWSPGPGEARASSPSLSGKLEGAASPNTIKSVFHSFSQGAIECHQVDRQNTLTLDRGVFPFSLFSVLF